MTLNEMRQRVLAFSESRPKLAAPSAVEALTSKWDAFFFSADKAAHTVNFARTRCGNIFLTLRLNRCLKCVWQANYSCIYFCVN